MQIGFGNALIHGAEVKRMNEAEDKGCFERYTLILKHEMDYRNGDRVQIDPPYVLSMVVDRLVAGNGFGTPFFLNEMLDRFKYEILKKESNVE